MLGCVEMFLEKFDINMINLFKDEIYSKDEVSFFFKLNEEYGELSNMYMLKYPMVTKINGVTELWRSSEHLYQACKYDDNIEVCPQSNPDCEVKSIRKRIKRAKTPMQAKMTQKCGKDLIRSDWEDIKVDAMLWVLCLKAQQNNKFVQVLKSTANNIIVEKSRKDTFWGCKEKEGKFVGKNVLGKLLVIVRDNLNNVLNQDFSNEGYLLYSSQSLVK
jgi:ribA/ribD-fused uncharacterized protein